MRNLLFFFLLVFSYSVSFSQKIVGDWEGYVDINGNKLTILFHFNKESTGEISGKWDSPMQMQKNLPFSNIRMDGDSVDLEIKMIAGSFKGKFIGEDSIAGTWHQGGAQFVSNFKRSVFAKEIPYPNEKEISLTSSIGTLIYGTLLSKNKNQKLAIIIPGSGPTDRDGNNPLGVAADSYKMLAHALDSQNIASFRYDKSFIGKSTVTGFKEEDVSFENSIQDVENIIDYLQDTLGYKNIFLIGHSEGSLIGMVVAQRKKIKGYISLAGMGRPFDTIVEEQLNTQGWADSLQTKATFIFDQLKKGNVVKDIPAPLKVLFNKSIQPYLISLLKYNPVQEIKKVNCPILIVQGSCDMQITEEDAENLHTANKKSSLEIIQGMTHTLKDAGNNCAEQNKTYMDSSIPLDAHLIKFVSGFIQKN